MLREFPLIWITVREWSVWQRFQDILRENKGSSEHSLPQLTWVQLNNLFHQVPVVRSKVCHARTFSGQIWKQLFRRKYLITQSNLFVIWRASFSGKSHRPIKDKLSSAHIIFEATTDSAKWWSQNYSIKTKVKQLDGNTIDYSRLLTYSRAFCCNK